MKKTIVSLVCLAALGLASPAMAQVSTQTVHVKFQGPGGHSNGAYSATSALHAAGRALVIMRNDAALPRTSYKVTGLEGGNSVNSIASDGRYTVHLTAANPTLLAAYLASVKSAAARGASDENKFRCAAIGSTTGTGANLAPRDIRVDVDGVAIPALPEQVTSSCTQG